MSFCNPKLLDRKSWNLDSGSLFHGMKFGTKRVLNFDVLEGHKPRYVHLGAEGFTIVLHLS